MTSCGERGMMKLITAKELADLLKVPVTWVYGQTRNDRIPCLRVGKHLRFDEVEIEAWLREQ